jgi:hypothetical protein
MTDEPLPWYLIPPGTDPDLPESILSLTDDQLRDLCAQTDREARIRDAVQSLSSCEIPLCETCTYLRHELPEAVERLEAAS